MNNQLVKIIRFIINRTGVSRSHFYIKYYRSRRGTENITHLLEATRSERFSKIYEKGVWLNERVSGALSGSGSEFENTTKIREKLPQIISLLNIKTLLDIGCGDWTWMRHVEIPCNYIGVDIVPSVIEKNISEFSNPGRSFKVLDAVDDELPYCDAILAREVIFHLSFADTRSMIKNILLSNAKFLFVTTDPNVEINTDIRSGDFRMLNLNLKPFCFPPPFLTMQDDGVCAQRLIGIWKIEDLQNVVV